MPTKQIDLSKGTQLFKQTDLEPSGLAYFGSKIYIASDNGIIASMNPDGTERANVFTLAPEVDEKYGDFESIATDGTNLYVGLEGGAENDKPKFPKVVQFDTSTNKIQGYHWSLSSPEPAKGKNNGMEAFTHYSGDYYFMAFQSEKGVIYVYNLNKNNSGGGLGTAVKFTLPEPDGNDGKLSDLYWHGARQRLYALYDSNAKSGANYLQELSVTVTEVAISTTQTEKVYSATQTDLWITPAYCKHPDISTEDLSTADWESCTFVGDDLYLGLDRSHPSTNTLYKFADFAKPAS